MTSIADIMTTDPTTIEYTDPVSDAHRALQEAPYHHLVVTNDNRPIGVVSTTDMLRLIWDADAPSPAELRHHLDHEFTLDDAMSVDLQTVPVSGTVREVAAVLSDGSFHSVVIVDDDGELAGIVTTTDLARYVCDSEA